MAVKTCSQDDGYYSTAIQRMTRKRKMQHLCQGNFFIRRLTTLKYERKRYEAEKVAQDSALAASILGRV
jgi:hypothetical protein